MNHKQLMTAAAGNLGKQLGSDGIVILAFDESGFKAGVSWGRDPDLHKLYKQILDAIIDNMRSRLERE